MKKILNILAITLSLSIILSFSNIVKAEDTSNDFSLTSPSMLKAGDTVELILSIDSLNVDGGINAIKGTLDYDSTIFEEVPDTDTLSTDSDFDNYNLLGLNRWQVGIYSSTSKMFTLERNTKSTSTGEVLKIKLKAKENITATSTIVNVKDIQISGGEETGDISIGSEKCTINANAHSVSESSEETIYSQGIGAEESKTSSQPTTTSTTPSTKQATKSQVDDTTAKGVLPQTGASNIIIISIIAVVILTILIYKKYKKI